MTSCSAANFARLREQPSLHCIGMRLQRSSQSTSIWRTVGRRSPRTGGCRI